MLVGTTDESTHKLAAKILLDEIGLNPTIGQQAIMWLDPNDRKIKWVVGYDSFVGKTCQIHTANLGLKSMPRMLIWAGFDYPFNRCGIETVISTVNSNNDRAMTYNSKLGFKEVFRFEKCHDDDGDIVVFKMNKADCRWIRG